MTFRLMIYFSAVAVLIGLAAIVLERVALWRRFPLRWAWATGLLLSLLLPTLALLSPPGGSSVPVYAIELPQRTTATETQGISDYDVVSPRPVVLTPAQVSARRLSSASWDQILRTLWLTLSVGLAATWGIVSARLRGARARWERRYVDNEALWVTESLGPAVHGCFKPVILMPRWALQYSSEMLGAVIRHEQEHIAAHDHFLMLLGRSLLIITPWNLPLWWQFRRLRFAIEVDCDARVLARGVDRRQYGEMLLDIGKRRTLMPVGAIALTEPASQLLGRIRILMSPIPKKGNLVIATAVGLCVMCVAMAADLRAPHADEAVSIMPPASAGMPRKPPPPSDEARLRSIRHLVEQTYPDLFSPTAGSRPVFVTLLLNPDGTLYASYKQDVQPLPYIKDSVQAFKVLGVDYERRGQGLKLRMPTPGGHSYVDVAAWYFQKNGQPWSDPTSAIDRAIAEHYFPDLYTASMDWPRADPWVLLDRHGNVLKTGRRVVDSGADVKLYIESMYPDIKTAEFRAETIHPAETPTTDREWPYVCFVWLANDSPVTDVSRADLSKRKDLFLYADVNDGGKTSYTPLVAMTLGSPTVISENPYSDPRSIEYIEVTAADAGADAVALRLRSQRVGRGLNALQLALQVASGPDITIPSANPAAWSAETAPIRVRYGDSGQIDVTDPDGHKWSIVLHPTRLKRASG